MLRNIARAFVFGLMLSGCVAPKFNYQPETKNISFPPLNQVETAYVGDYMINQGTVTSQDVMILDAPVDFGLLKMYTLSKGFYVKAGEDKTDSYYLPSPSPGGGKVEKAAIADPFKAIAVKKDKGELCIVTVFNAAICEPSKFNLGKKRLYLRMGFSNP